MKTPANHPWKRRRCSTKVAANCLACGKEFQRDPEAGTKTCSEECYKQYARVRHIAHLTRGGFR